MVTFCFLAIFRLSIYCFLSRSSSRYNVWRKKSETPSSSHVEESERRATRKQISLHKRGSSEVDAETSTSIWTWKCFKTLKFFQISDESFQNLQKTMTMHGSQQYRRHILMSLLTSDATYFFNGQRVSKQFFFSAFRFGNDMLIDVRKCMATHIARQGYSHVESSSRRFIDSGPGAQRKATILSFLTRLLELVADRMPDKAKLDLTFFERETLTIVSDLITLGCMTRIPSSILFWVELDAVQQQYNG